MFWLSFFLLSCPALANPSYGYVPSVRQTLLGQESLLEGCHELLKGFKTCHYRLPYVGQLGDHTIEDTYRGSAETGIYVDRIFKSIADDVRVVIGEVEIPIPDGDGTFFIPLPMNVGPTVTIKLVNQFGGAQTFDSDATALIRSVTLVKSNAHYIQEIISNLPELKSAMEKARQRYLEVKRNLRLLTLTKDNATVYLTSILGRDAQDLSGNCLEPLPLEPEECGVLAIIVGLLKGDSPGITPRDKEAAFAELTRTTRDLGQALTTLQSAEREYSESYRRAYGEAYNLLIQETPQ
jgi:hypothetical protein